MTEPCGSIGVHHVTIEKNRDQRCTSQEHVAHLGCNVYGNRLLNAGNARPVIRDKQAAREQDNDNVERSRYILGFGSRVCYW
jgi:hypothetical protein